MQTLSPQAFANVLRKSAYGDGEARSVALGPGRSITYNVNDLTAQERGLARAAVAEWSTITGIDFVETGGTAQITYINDRAGANTTTSIQGTTLLSSTINVASERVAPGDGYGSYAFRTYMHETAHALGLGHPQRYADGSDFSQSTITNDSWQMSLMSYYSQAENTAINASVAYNLTPMLADYMAIRATYGAVPVHAGNTVYGVGSTAGGALDQITRTTAPVTFLIADTGGRDTLSFAGDARGMTIDLRSGAISNVLGLVGNMQIALDTLIENAVGGVGNDVIIGNQAANTLNGGGGRDAMFGGAGNDSYFTDGGDRIGEGVNGGYDTVYSSVDHSLQANVEALVLYAGASGGYGNALNNRITGNPGANRMNGGLGADVLVGWGGDDVYIVDGLDQVVEGAGGGTDTVLSAVSHRLTGHVENAILTGAASVNLTGNGRENILRGNDGNNIITGGGGADRLVGLGGHDAYVVDGLDTVIEVDGGGIDTMVSAGTFTLAAWVERGIISPGSNADLTGNDLDNYLRGNTSANRIEGRGGNDIIDARGGADVLVGGTGDDVYFLTGRETVIEQAGEGYDIVYSQSSYNLTENVERLVLSGTASVGAGGNLGDNLIVGNAGDNLLSGGAGGNDVLIGNAGSDRFLFRNGSDVIWDFADGEDSIIIAGRANNITTTAEAMAAAQQVGNDVLFDFGANDLLVRNVTLQQLQGDVTIG